MRINNDSGGSGPPIPPVTVRSAASRRTAANAYCLDQEETLGGAQHAAMRERFNCTLTQCLIGRDSLVAAVNGVIELIYKELDWEWGAYWALEQDGRTLRCQSAWDDGDRGLAPFGGHSAALPIAPGQGLVGRVCQTGQAQWVDRPANDPGFLRRARAKECGLLAEYMFPVTYTSADGRQRRPGVLEFFSKSPRQQDAQLPGLVASISGLIAQTAQRMLTDDLTGLASRNHFLALLDEACARTPASAWFGLLYIDLDQFKPINDAFGHLAGNAVLSEFVQRLQALAPVGCAIGRVGGDQFAILAGPEISAAGRNALAENVLHAARSVFHYEGKELSISASVGNPPSILVGEIRTTRSPVPLRTRYSDQ